MQKVNVNLKITYDYSYPIYIGGDLFKGFTKYLAKHFNGKQLVLVSDATIAGLYTKQFVKCLENSGYEVLSLTIPSGEKYKNSKTKEKLESQMFEHKINRNCLIIAFGGGVVGDLVGYTASTYMRGIKYVQVPTTMLSMIDSSVGGKTAINTAYGKNLIGTFYQPQFVFLDFQLLKSLPHIHKVNGLIEAIKIFLTFDKIAFEYVQNHLFKILSFDAEALLYIISKAVALKAHVVENDEKEENLRMSLNFGHTIGHGIERISNYRMMHGVAVGIGIILEAKLANKFGKLSDNDLSVIEKMFGRLGIKTSKISKYDKNAIADSTLLDKKNKSNNKIKCVLLAGIGEIAYSGENNDLIATDVTHSDVLQILKD